MKTKKINLTITGCLGRMGQQLIKSASKDKRFKINSLTENKLQRKKILGILPKLNNSEAFKRSDVIIDFTIPKCTLEVLNIAAKQKKRVIIGTTGFTLKEENIIKKISKKIPILKAGNMSLGINLLMYLTEIASKSLGNNFLSKVLETHHKFKKDYPSGTALMLGQGIAIGKSKNFYGIVGKKYLNKKKFPYGKKINFNSVRKGNIIFLPANSGFHYPDIVRASDVVVGKVGYGTLAECWSANIPILGCYRDDFRESEKLEDFARQHLCSESITLKELENGSWLTRAMDIQPSREYGKTSDRRSGSESAAKEIINFMIETVKNSGN